MATIPAPARADSTTNICERPVNGANSKPDALGAAVTRTAVTASSTTAADTGGVVAGASGCTRRRAVRVTRLKANVHCGMGVKALEREAVTKVDDAAPTTVKAEIAKRLLGARKTAAAHPTKHPL